MRRYLAGLLLVVCAGIGGLSPSIVPPTSAVTGADGGDRPERSHCLPASTSDRTETGGAAGLLLPEGLDGLTARSDLVVLGTVSSFRTCLEQDSIVTEVLIAPKRVIKGALPSTVGPVRVVVPGGRYGPYRLIVSGAPEFTIGETSVLFLQRSADGFEVVDGARGQLEVTKTGKVGATGLSVGELVDRLAKAAEGDLSLEEDPVQEAKLTAASGQRGYSLLGVKWPDSAIPVPFYANVEANRPGHLSVEGVRDAFVGAFESWERVSGSYIAFRYAGDTSRTSGADGCPGYDGANDVTFGIADTTHSSRTLAVAHICANAFTGQIVDLDIEVDVDHFGDGWRLDGSDYDLQTVALHEAGHFAGLGHSSQEPIGACPVMYPYYLGLSRSPCADDVAGVSALYPVFVPAADSDGDGISDVEDNCPDDWNPGQADLDLDGVGDSCDVDDDGDGVADGSDNCPVVSNPGQADLDSDGLGDLCDDDDDGDAIPDPLDNCPRTSNSSQDDLDGDGTGDACDADIDGDEVANEVDNCPELENFDQRDLDGDGLGDVCDPDDDGDGITDLEDNCPVTANPRQQDLGSDGLGDDCDPDDDRDGYPDWVELARGSNPLESGSTPEACDGEDNDLDGDTDEGFPDENLNAIIDCLDPEIDTDGDGLSNDVDFDDDGDGFTDAVENLVGTNPLSKCGSADWPPDFNGDNAVSIADVLAFRGSFGARFGDALYERRLDLRSDGRIWIGDVLALKPYLGGGCS